MSNAQAGAPSIIAIIGPDGAGKSTLLQEVAALSFGAARAVQVNGRAASVLDVRTPHRLLELVDFADVNTQAALLGASRFAGAVLVVSASDGPMAGHQAILSHARQLGIPLAAIALTKCDLVDDDELTDLVEMEARELVNKHRMNGDTVPVVRVRANSERPHEGREPEPTRGRLGGPQALVNVLAR
jgi:elongation factor Tu